MGLQKKPSGLVSRFNKAAKTLLSITALSVALIGCSEAAYIPFKMKTTTPIFNQQNDLQKRTVRLLGAITKKSAIIAIEQLMALSRQDPKADIVLKINSGGGSVTEGMAIYDVMKSLPNDIRTICEGNAQSMAAVLLTAGTQGKRYAYPNCQIMYHQPAAGIKGKITDMELTLAEINVLKNKLTNILAKHTGWSEKVIRDLTERDFYPNKKEAQKMGFIDHIIKEKNPDTAPTKKTKLPEGFCDNLGRKHLHICNP